MATAQMTSDNDFSLANFKKAFEKSPARQYMSQMEVEQVRLAIEEKDLRLLEQLFEILMQEQVTNEKIVRDFVLAKNRLTDSFIAEATDVEKKLVQGPIKKKAAKVQKKDEKSADELLEGL